jgi:hypothetical protein
LVIGNLLCGLPGERPTIVGAAPAIISRVLAETLVITTQEAIAVGLLILVAATVPSVVAVAAVVAVTIAIEVGPLRIVVLVSLSVSLARKNAVPITIVHGDLIDRAVSPISVVTTIIAIPPIIPVAPIISILAPWPLRLDGCARCDSDAYQKGQCQQDSPDFVPEIV